MKRTLVTVLGSAALLVAVSPVARADAFLSLTNGVTKSCDNSTAAGVTACTAAGFTTVLGANLISFTGSVGGYSVTDVTLNGNSPGSPAVAFAVDTKNTVTNLSAGATSLTVNFAINNFALPAGSPLALTASHSGTFTNGVTTDREAFMAWGNSANTLVVGSGVAEAVPLCSSPGGAGATACAAAGLPVNFTRAGAFALNGSEVITLTQNPAVNASFTATVNAQNVVPEPGSLVLLATGFIGLVGGRRVWRRKA
jgi:hypothetical protein